MYDSYESSTGALAGLMAFIAANLLVGLVLGLFITICIFIIYRKAGKHGWESLVPVYNIVVLLDIVDLPAWYIVLFLVPFANIYVVFKIYIELAHKFGKSTIFGVLCIFIPIIGFPMLAFSKNGYENNNDNKEYSNNIYKSDSITTNSSDNVEKKSIEDTINVVPIPSSERPMMSSPVEPSQSSERPMMGSPIAPSERPMMSSSVAPSQPSERPMMSSSVAPSQPSERPMMGSPVAPSQPSERPMMGSPVAPSERPITITDSMINDSTSNNNI